MKQMKQKLITNFQLVNHFCSLPEFKTYIKELKYKTIKTQKKIEYINLSCTIDIEASSFYDTNNEKVGLMYCFTIGINGVSYLGRTKHDLQNILTFIFDAFDLSRNKRNYNFIVK